MAQLLTAADVQRLIANPSGELARRNRRQGRRSVRSRSAVRCGAHARRTDLPRHGAGRRGQGPRIPFQPPEVQREPAARHRGQDGEGRGAGLAARPRILQGAERHGSGRDRPLLQRRKADRGRQARRSLRRGRERPDRSRQDQRRGRRAGRQQGRRARRCRGQQDPRQARFRRHGDQLAGHAAQPAARLVRAHRRHRVARACATIWWSATTCPTRWRPTWCCPRASGDHHAAARRRQEHRRDRVRPAAAQRRPPVADADPARAVQRRHGVLRGRACRCCRACRSSTPAC